MPNVNHMSSSGGGGSGGNGQHSIDLQSALSNLEEMKQHGRIPSRERRHASPSGLLNPRGMHHHLPQQQMHHNHPHAHQHQPRSITQSSDHHRRTSPASPYSTPYLSPPDTWRRTNSDSALHQSSLMAERAEGSASSFLPHSHVTRRSPVQLGSSSLTNISHAGNNGSVAQSTSGSWDVDRSSRLEYEAHGVSLSSSVGAQGGMMLETVMMSSGLRPKSCDVPGITIYPSPTEENHENAPSHHIHIPISANTGSLPDLTSFHFPAPLSTPIDADEQSVGPASTNSHSPASVNNNNTHSSSSQFAFHPSSNNPNHPHGNGGERGGGGSGNNSNHGSCVNVNVAPSSPYSTQRNPPSPYSVNSNPNSPFSPQSPLSALGYSPPGDASHLTHDNIMQMKEAANCYRQQQVCYSCSSVRGSNETPRITVEVRRRV